MKKTFAAFGAALALTAGLGMAVQPAFAETAVTTQPTITKNESINDGEFVPAQSFSFKIEAGDMTGLDTKLYKQGGASDFTVPAIEFQKSGTDNGGKRTADTKITIPEDYANTHEPGIYVYKLSEVDGGYKGVQYDKTAYRLFVQVDETPAGKKVAAVWTSQADGTEKADATFSNRYTYSPEPDKPGEPGGPHTHNLTVTKAIKGNAASADQDFSFTVAAKDTSNSSSVKDVYTVVTPDGTVELEAGKSVTVKIKAGQSIVIKGVTADDQIVVTEVNPEAIGYVVSYENGDNATFDNCSADASQTVTNTKNNTPTGLFVEYGPFVAMVAAAGVLVGVSKKRVRE